MERRKKIKAMLPIYACAKFQITKPDHWEKMDNMERRMFFMENMETVGSLCHHCNRNIESDFELDEFSMNRMDSEDFFEMLWEE